MEALRSDTGEIPGELREFSEDHRSTSDEAVDQRLLAHRHNLTLGEKKCTEGETEKLERESLMGFLFGCGEREGIYFPTRLDEKLLDGQWCLSFLTGLLFHKNNENTTHTVKEFEFEKGACGSPSNFKNKLALKYLVIQ